MSAQQDELFPELPPDPEPAAPAPQPRLSRAEKQAALISNGQHPMALLLRAPLPLHPDAERVTEPGQPNAGPTCGGCKHRALWGHHNRSYPKCSSTRISHGEATDIRAWWPACTRWEATS